MTGLNTFQIRVIGTRPLLMHNARLSNPLDPIRKQLSQVTSKKTKTDSDHLEIAHLEWLGGLYYDEQHGPYVPGENIEKALVLGARLTKAGQKILRGVMIDTEINPVVYDGPRTLTDMWEAHLGDDENTKPYVFMKSVVVQTSRTIRTRPRFPTWAVTATGRHDPAVIELEELGRIASTAGSMIGLGDYRPRYGRFVADVVPVLIEDQQTLHGEASVV